MPASAQDAHVKAELRHPERSAAESKGAGREGSAQGNGHALKSKGPWLEVDWDTALDTVAGKFASVKQASGGDAFAVLTSAKCTNEENFLVAKLTRQVLATNSIDHCARL